MLSLSTLLKSGFTPTLKDFNNLLIFLSKNQRFNAVIHFFSQLSSNKINGDAQSHTIFAQALLKEHKYEEAAGLLKTLTEKPQNLNKNRIFDRLVQGICTYNKDPEKALSLLKRFLETGDFIPSSRTFCLLIYGFCSMRKMDEVIELLELMSGDKLNYPFDNYVCSSVISGLVKIGEPEFAVAFYENAVKSGSLKPNVVTCTSAVTAYCKLRSVDKISDLVSWMENNSIPFDVVFYSNWIYGYLKEGLIEDGFRKFREMVGKKLELDTISYTILINGFSNNGNVEKAVGFLYKMRKDRIRPNLVTYTSIILGFCKKGKLEEAFAIFDMLETLGFDADEFTYAILIDGVCREGDFDRVFRILDEMEEKGINPGIVTHNTVINGLCKFGRTVEADRFSKGIIGDNFTYSTLLHGYAQEGSATGILEIKKRVQEAGVHMDLVMCNVLIKALFMVGLFEDARAVYKELPQLDLTANSVTYCTLIDGYCKSGLIDEALEIFGDFRETENSSSACYNCIISGLCNKGMFSMAVDVFIEYFDKGFSLNRRINDKLIKAALDREGVEGVLNLIYRMENFDLQELSIICNDAIRFLCKSGFADASCDVLFFMRNNGLELTRICYYSILRSLLFEGKIFLARLILTSFVKIYGMSDTKVIKILVHYLCLIDLRKTLDFLSKMNEKNMNITIPAPVFETLAYNGRVLDAYELLTKEEKNLPSMNVVDCSIIIDALCNDRHIDKALNLCSLFKKKGISLNTFAYNSVIHGLCSQGCLVEAFRLFDSMENLGVPPSEITYGTLIDALTREGFLLDAKILFERMFEKGIIPTTHIYNSFIDGYCKCGQLDEAIELFNDLDVRNLEPDGFTIGALINGYCQKGDMEGALKLFFEFKGKMLLPDFLGFMYLMRGLCAKGRMEESRGVLREMLLTESVVEILRRVDSEIQSDSLENLLISLCDDGRIVEAVSVLEEVGSIIFSNSPNRNDLEVKNVDKKLDKTLEVCGGEDGKMAQFQDFDSFYSVVSSLCSNGELDKANRLTKLLMELSSV